MRLAWSVCRATQHETAKPPATARIATLMAKVPFQPIPELSVGGAVVILD